MKNFAECFVLVAMGFFFGFLACQSSIQTRYIASLAERHESEASYWLGKLDDQIQENKGKIAQREEKEK